MSSSSSSVSARNYIVDQKPDKFGGKQEEYLQRRNDVIRSGVAQIREAVQGKKDLKALFFKILDQFALERYAIAVAHGTEKAGHFGRKRMDTAGGFHFTALSELYEEFNGKMLSLFQEVLRGKLPLSGEPGEKKFQIEKKGALNRRCFFEIEIISNKDIAEREWDQVLPMRLALQYITLGLNYLEPKIDETRLPPTPQEQRSLKAYNDSVKEVKKKCPEFYRHDKIGELLRGLNYTYPTKKIDADGKINPRYSPNNLRNLLVFGKLRIEIGGGKYALSEYITWAHLDGRTDPVERMKNTHVTILHQDRFLIDDMLQETASIFERAIRADSSIEKVTELKDQAAFIRYLFAHAMPFSRGSAAIGEWIENMIYQYHGYEVERNPKTMGDLEALTTLWSTFREEKYDGTITLKK
jgi:Avirulence protein